MTGFSFERAYRTPTIFSDDIFTPFADIGMGDWTDDQIGEFFEGRRVLDIGSGYEGVARRLFAIFENSKNAPEVVNLNPQFSDWRMVDMRVGGMTTSVARSRRADIEAGIREAMEYSDEDYEGYMSRRIAVAGLIQGLEYGNDYFDIQVSTWAFPNVFYDCMGSRADTEAGYREVLRTQRRGGVALLAPIRHREEAHTARQLDELSVPNTYCFKPATDEGKVLELRAT